jgi:hypothetical protein
MQQCPVLRSMDGGVAVRSTIPGKEERILETEMQAGRAAGTIGGHSMQAVQHAAQIAGQRYRRSRRAGAAGGKR